MGVAGKRCTEERVVARDDMFGGEGCSQGSDVRRRWV
jgi:hypothetical protein